jgi:hypothetical protein
VFPHEHNAPGRSKGSRACPSVDATHSLHLAVGMCTTTVLKSALNLHAWGSHVFRCDTSKAAADGYGYSTSMPHKTALLPRTEGGTPHGRTEDEQI